MLYHQGNDLITCQFLLRGTSGRISLRGARTTETARNHHKGYVQRIGKPLWVVSEDMERDVFMSAKEAKTYGIVDAVAIENT